MPYSITLSGHKFSVLFDIVTETGTTRTSTLSDAGKYIRCTSSSPVSITINSDASVGWNDNCEIMFEQAGAGKITIVAGTSVTINSSETLKSLTQYSVMGIKRVAANTWTLFGEREAAP
jgi:hypothetical protein